MSVKDLGKTKRCEVCGKKFTVNTPTQKYCSTECRVKLNRELNRLYKGIQDKPIIKRSPKGSKKGKKKEGKKVYITRM